MSYSLHESWPLEVSCRCQVLCGSQQRWPSEAVGDLYGPISHESQNHGTWMVILNSWDISSEKCLRVSSQISPWLEMGKSYIINNYTLERIRGWIWTWHFLEDRCWRLAKTIWPTWRLQTGRKQFNHEWARNQRTQNLKGLLCLCWWNTAMGATQPRNSQDTRNLLGLSTFTCPDWLRVTPPISLAKCGHFPSSCLTAKSTLIVSSRQWVVCLLGF